ncbi:MAG: toprim domain-containing protein [Thermoplasmata archaeon]
MKEEKIMKLIEELKDQNSKIPILVEGNRDIKALRNLGFTGKILKINEGLTLRDVAENIAGTYREIIIFMDWDRKGNMLEKAMLTYLQYYSVTCNIEFKRKIAYYSKRDIRCVEELYHYVLQITEKIKKG